VKQQVAKQNNPVVSPGAKPLFFQPKLTVNEPNDVYEQEADHMADQVMRMPDPLASRDSFFKPADKAIQRKCAHCEQEEKMLHRKESSAGEVGSGSQLANYVSSLSTTGQTLSAGSRQFFEPRFGHDFSNVRIHTDAVAAKSAQSINALAYTTGNNIVFNSGQYSPETSAGQRLMAHELTHVVQQGGNLTSNIQREVKAPAPACSMVSAIPSAERYNFVVNTDTFVDGEEKRLTDKIATLDAKLPIDVLGMASSEGPEANNVDLSCKRAQKVGAIIISLGHTVSKQTATGGYPGSDHDQAFRAVALNYNIPTPNCPVTCNTPIVLFSDTTNCGSGDDFLNNDLPGGPRPRATNFIVAHHYSSISDADLLEKMKRGPDGVATLGGAPGNDVADHFFKGSGTPMNHPVGTPIGLAASNSASFKSTSSAVESALNFIITNMATDPAANKCSSLSLTSGAVPQVNFPFPLDPTATDFKDNLMLKAVIGGTHGIEITLTNLTIDCTAHTYEATIHYSICDNFGVDDTSDLYADSLISFWVLQHMRPGHAAFINNILLDTKVKESF